MINYAKVAQDYHDALEDVLMVAQEFGYYVSDKETTQFTVDGNTVIIIEYTARTSYDYAELEKDVMKMPLSFLLDTPDGRKAFIKQREADRERQRAAVAQEQQRIAAAQERAVYALLKAKFEGGK